MDDRTTTSFTKVRPTEKPAEKPAERPATTVVPKRRGRSALLFLLLLALAIGIGIWIYSQRVTQAPGRRDFANAPVAVGTAAAVTDDIDISLNALGTVTSLATVTVQSQISGYLTRVAFVEGQTVKKGDLLAEIDSRPYELALAQAQGALQRDQALLQAAELDLKRYQDLVKSNAIPRQQLDTQTALVIQDRGNVLSDQAQIDAQRLNIEYCHITSPVNGIVGLRLVDQGNYVTPQSATGLVVITQIEPITVIFPIAEDYLPQIMGRMRSGATLPVTAFDRSGAMQLSSGELRAYDSQINTTTGTLNMRAQFANTDHNLFPNQFVNVKVLVDVLRNVTVVPTAAVQRGAPGTFVYMINPDNTVEVRPVVLGPTSGDRVAITSGLVAGDRFVVDGADKLRNGARVVARSGPGAVPAGANRFQGPPGRTGAGAPPGANGAPAQSPPAGNVPGAAPNGPRAAAPKP